MRLAPLILLPLTLAAVVRAQDPPAPPAPGAVDSVEMPAGAHHQAGPIRRFFFGTSYRDLWKTPIMAPVLDLATFGGGLRPLAPGGGKQTKTLYLITPNGAEFAFRSVNKDGEWGLPARFRGTIISAISRDQVSTSLPGAPLVVAPLLDAAGVLHPEPRLFVMPDDPRLGEYQRDFAGRLGTLEEFPAEHDGRAVFGNARVIVNSDTLLRVLNAGASHQVDARAFLRARLVDMLINDWDRHPGQWRWARHPEARDTAWLPIPRDRDKAFASYTGLIASFAQLVAPPLARFRDHYPSIRALTWNSAPLDRRLLAGLERPVYDSIARDLMARLTDSVIDDAVRHMPPAYHGRAPELATTLKRRRDLLPDVAHAFYRNLAAVVDVHASDETESARITREPGAVRVQVTAGGTVRLDRRFVDGETSEIRLYLHGGDDSATVTGSGSSIVVRVVGGNGRNQLTGETRARYTRLYDNGDVDDVRYGRDSLFDRRPWVREFGHLVPPTRDRGTKLGPAVGFTIDGDLGFVPRLGVNRYRYAFGHHPYASRVTLEGEYATTTQGGRVSFTADRRMELSHFHFVTAAQWSQLELINWHGLGNDTPDDPGASVRVNRQQLMLYPALAFGIGRRSDVFLGPVVKYSITDSTPGSLLAATQPYGVGRFGQAGVRAAIYYDVRDQPRDSRAGLLLDAAASWYPGVWDVQRGFGTASGRLSLFQTLPLPLRPVLATRVGGMKSWGAFPWHEAAFIGGRGSAPDIDAQRYAGDAAAFGTTELRIPLARFSFILPLDVGIFGAADASRVYLDGASPGGWHTGLGAGFWIGILDPSAAISVTPLGGRSRTGVLIHTGFNF